LEKGNSRVVAGNLEKNNDLLLVTREEKNFTYRTYLQQVGNIFAILRRRGGGKEGW